MNIYSGTRQIKSYEGMYMFFSLINVIIANYTLVRLDYISTTLVPQAHSGESDGGHCLFSKVSNHGQDYFLKRLRVGPFLVTTESCTGG